MGRRRAAPLLLLLLLFLIIASPQEEEERENYLNKSTAKESKRERKEREERLPPPEASSPSSSSSSTTTTTTTIPPLSPSPPPYPPLVSSSIYRPMESSQGSATTCHDAGVAQPPKEARAGLVDPFLVDVLENPRHRLTVLRMELDIQRFMQNPEQQQFEFPPLPTSYLRCAAHRVAQHYGLHTTVLDNIPDGLGSRVVALKTTESRFPPFHLSDIPTKQTESQKSENIKIAIRQRPNKASQGDAAEVKAKRNMVKTVEEREEEYEKARARIFSGFTSLEKEVPSSVIAADGRDLCLSRGDQENLKSPFDDPEIISTRDGVSRIAILRDREKDRSDPDYDRSYDRYIRGVAPSQNFGLGSCNVFQIPFSDYEAGFSQFGHLPRNQSCVNLNACDMSPHYGMGSYQTPGDALYVQFPTPAAMYANSYEHLRHGVFQAPPYQLPLSFEQFQKY